NSPIREMPLTYVPDWFFAACNPPLAKSIWMYLLPRVLEDMACGQDPSYAGLEVSLSRFPTGDRSQWTDAQWQVLDGFQRQFLHDQVRRRENALDDVLCMYGNVGWSLAELFAQVAAMPDHDLIPKLWADWCQGRPTIWITAFWEASGNSAAFAFYTSQALYDRIVATALSDDTDPDLAAKAMRVTDAIFANADWAL
ncbi:hypothetical protein HA397_28530, partial [Escherichia coli]|nr:hypothetical protein [Escherichia coli]